MRNDEIITPSRTRSPKAKDLISEWKVPKSYDDPPYPSNHLANLQEAIPNEHDW